jgi:hypothetical protein
VGRRHDHSGATQLAHHVGHSLLPSGSDRKRPHRYVDHHLQTGRIGVDGGKRHRTGYVVLKRIPRHQEHAQGLGHAGLRAGEVRPCHSQLGQHLFLDRRSGYGLDHVGPKAGEGTCAAGAHPHNAIPRTGRR